MRLLLRPDIVLCVLIMQTSGLKANGTAHSVTGKVCYQTTKCKTTLKKDWNGGRMLAQLKSIFHNVIVHPILPFMPRKWAKVIHERNALWAYGKDGPFNGLD